MLDNILRRRYVLGDAVPALIPAHEAWVRVAALPAWATTPLVVCRPGPRSRGGVEARGPGRHRASGTAGRMGQSALGLEWGRAGWAFFRCETHICEEKGAPMDAWPEALSCRVESQHRNPAHAGRHLLEV